jgi:5-methylcytosine-specific restriction endonuclease McrA
VHFSTVDEFSGGPSLKKPIPKRVRAAVFRRDGAQCVYCSDTTGPFHLDHIMPQSRGGTDVASNLAVACATCNISKRDKTPEEWGGKPGRSFTLERVDLIRAGDV